MRSTDSKISELMERIRSELASRSAPPARAAAAARGPILPALLDVPSPHLPKATFEVRDAYALGDFLALHDRDFIDAAYLGLLKRAPDPSGTAHFLQGLRDGQLSKIEILGRMRYSPEGRALGVPVTGLASSYNVQRLYRLPIIGFFLALASAALRLPRIVRSLQALEGYQHQRNAEMEVQLATMSQVVNANERELAAVVQATAKTVADQATRLSEKATRLGDLGAQHARIQSKFTAATEQAGVMESRLSAVEQRASTHEKAEVALRAELSDKHARLEQFDQRLDSIAVSATQVAAALRSLETSSAHSAAVLETRVAMSQTTAEAALTRLALLEAANAGWEKRLSDLDANAHERAIQFAATAREAILSLEQRVAGLDQQVSAEHGSTSILHQRLAERLARVEGRVHEHALRFIEPAAALESAPQKLQKKKLHAGAQPASSRFAALYLAFENRFRGAPEDIRQRLAYYLPLLRDSVVGQAAATVLDIGCGRGEWLELLREHKFAASGIDINADMVAQCRERDLNVVVADAIAHLRQQPDNSIGALTAFHLIEHVPLDTMIELIEQAHRVVQPGGLLIFETPNPENLMVGACNFYTDPTHQRPLPPVMTQFLVEAGGFVEVEIHRVNANLLPKLFDEPDPDDSAALRSALTFLRSAFLCAPDYGIVARVA
jgi:SAM-dependent methyltransferase